MNPETLNLIERPFGEVVDDILTALVGGVVNEPIFFDLRSDAYPLAQTAQDVRGITGTREAEHHTFQKEIDFLFSQGDNAVVWQEGGLLPDDDTIFYVDYFRPPGLAPSPLSDINVGSVTRTLSEAVGREIATVYQQINRAYLQAFVDTAEGKSLDLVVAILGLRRQGGDFASGLVSFFRDPSVKGNVAIPEGILLSTEKGEAVFRTSQSRVLQQGQVRVDVPIRAVEDFPGEAGIVQAAAISQLSQPIAGIARVTNFEPTFLGAEEESDEELRARAKAAVRASGKATLAALAKAVFEARAELLEAYDPNSPPLQRTPPGTVTLLVDAEPERFEGVQAAVHETRAAGVLATVVARYVFITPRIQLQIRSGLPPAGKTQLVEKVIAAITAYVHGLPSGDPALGEELLKAAQGVEDVSKATLADVITRRADVLRPGPEALTDSLLEAVSSAAGNDLQALKSAIEGVLLESDTSLPSARRIPDRSLVQSLLGEAVQPEMIESGKFLVVSLVGGEKWRLAVDMDAADVVLQES